MNLIGTWGKGFCQPLWVMTNLEAKQGQRIYFARMKIDETFRDLKSLLDMAKLMNKQQKVMEKMLALLLLVFAIGLLIGEGLRDHLYGETIREQEVVAEKEPIAGWPQRKKARNGSPIQAYSSYSNRNGRFRLGSGRPLSGQR